MPRTHSRGQRVEVCLPRCCARCGDVSAPCHTRLDALKCLLKHTGESTHLESGMHIATRAKQLGFKIKLNTVVTRVNMNDDMLAVAEQIQPDRWKVFKVLPIEGQNNGIGHTGTRSPSLVMNHTASTPPCNMTTYLSGTVCYSTPCCGACQLVPIIGTS